MASWLTSQRKSRWPRANAPVTPEVPTWNPPPNRLTSGRGGHQFEDFDPHAVADSYRPGATCRHPWMNLNANDSDYPDSAGVARCSA